MGRQLPILLGVLACFLGINVSAWSQNTPTVNGIRGYLDPRTGAFRPVFPLPASYARRQLRWRMSAV